MLNKLVEDLRPYSRTDIAYESGVSIATVNGIMSGKNKNPTLLVLDALRQFADKKKKEEQKK